jgi:hypothetical protein
MPTLIASIFFECPLNTTPVILSGRRKRFTRRNLLQVYVAKLMPRHALEPCRHCRRPPSKKEKRNEKTKKNYGGLAADQARRSPFFSRKSCRPSAPTPSDTKISLLAFLRAGLCEMAELTELTAEVLQSGIYTVRLSRQEPSPVTLVAEYRLRIRRP